MSLSSKILWHVKAVAIAQINVLYQIPVADAGTQFQ